MVDYIIPDFLIIGAQKCGTTWLWEILKQHPGTDLGNKKEIFYFSSSTNYKKGRDWYYAHFQQLDPTKVIGEASTHYFYDHVLEDRLRVDESLPTIPELVVDELPEVKILLILRDPVKRALSAYYHHLRRRNFSPSLSIITASEQNPHLKIIEYGYYLRYLKAWQQFVSPERMCCLILEEDILQTPQRTAWEVYSFLDLWTEFKPKRLNLASNTRWGWTHLWLNYYMGPWYGFLYRQAGKFGASFFLDMIDLMQPPTVQENEIDFLRSLFFPEKEVLENLLDRKLNSWSYSA